jgi:hypothetical protein
MLDKDTWHEEIACLVQTAREDPVIKQRMLKMLQLNSYDRRSVLNIWLEQLRLRNASEELLYVLSCLFDDAIAQKTLSLINKSK